MSGPETDMQACATPQSASSIRCGGFALRSNRPIFAMFRSFGVQAMILAANMLTGIITARLLGPEGRGIYVAVTLWPTLLSSIAVAGLTSAVIFHMRRSPQAAGRIAGAALLLGGLLGVCASAIGAFSLPLLLAKYGADVVLFAQLCLANVVINCMVAVSKQSFAGVGEYWHCNLCHLLPQLLHLALLMALVAVGPLTTRGAVLALLASSGLTLIFMLPQFVRSLRPRLQGAWKEARGLAVYTLRAAPTDVVLTLATYSDRLILIPLLPAAELGFYAVAFSFSRVIQFVQPAINSIFLSHLSTQAKVDGKRLHDRAYRLLLVILGAGCLLLWSTSHALLTFAYGAEFAAADVVFKLLVVEASLGVLSQVTAQLFMACNRPGTVSTIQVIVLCVSVAALSVLVPRYGGIGAALGLLGAGVLRWLLLMVALKSVLRLPLPTFYPTREDVRYVVERLR